MLLNCLKLSFLAEASLEVSLAIDLDDSKNWIAAEDIVLSADCRAAIDRLRSTPRKLEFLNGYRWFYLEASRQLRSRLSLSCPVLQWLNMLNPRSGKCQTASNIYAVASRFRSVVPTSQLTKIQREWQIYQIVSDHTNFEGFDGRRILV